MKYLTKLVLVVFAGLMLAQCSTYKIKSDMNKDGESTSVVAVGLTRTTEPLSTRTKQVQMKILMFQLDPKI